MADTLHVRYAYEGRIPEGPEAVEFDAWQERARGFVAAMRQRVVERERQEPGR